MPGNGQATNNPESEQAGAIVDERLGKSTDDQTLDETIIVRSAAYTVDDPEFKAEVEQIYAGLTALGKDVFLGGATYYMTQAPTMVSTDRHTTMIPFTMPEDGHEKIDQIYALGDQYASSAFEVFHTGNASFAGDSIKLGETQAMNGERIGIEPP
jgi:hypothetical protein